MKKQTGDVCTFIRTWKLPSIKTTAIKTSPSDKPSGGLPRIHCVLLDAISTLRLLIAGRRSLLATRAIDDDVRWTMTSVRRRDDIVDVVATLLLLLDIGRTLPSSSLNYCHRLDDRPPRLYATKTAYDEVRAHDLEARQVLAGTDDSPQSATSGDSGASQFGQTDDYSCQR